MDNSEKLEAITQITTVMGHMKDIVNEVGGNFIYPRRLVGVESLPSGKCLYVYNEEPDCLIGKILHRMGVPLDILSGNEGRPAGLLCLDLRSDGVLRLDESTTVYILSRAQDMQDSGRVYGEVLKSSQERALDTIKHILEL